MIKYNVLLFLTHHDGNNVLVVLAFCPGLFRPTMALHGKAILHFSGNSALLGHVFSGNSHVVIFEGVYQAVVEHAVLQPAGSHAVTPPGLGNDVGNGAHGLTAAGDHQVIVSHLNGLGSALHGFHGCGAVFVGGKGRSSIRQPGVKGTLSGRIRLDTCLEVSADNHLVNFVRVNPRALNHGFHTLRAVNRSGHIP